MKENILRAFEKIQSWQIHRFLLPAGVLLMFFGWIDWPVLPTALISVGTGLIVWGFSIRQPRKIWNPLTGYYEKVEEKNDSG